MRNNLMHSDSMKVSTGDLATYIQTMVDLLEDPLKLLHDPAAQQAVIDIRQVTRRIRHMYHSVHNVSQQRRIIHTYHSVHNVSQQRRIIHTYHSVQNVSQQRRIIHTHHSVYNVSQQRRIIHTYHSVHNISQQRRIIHTYTCMYDNDDISYIRIYICIYQHLSKGRHINNVRQVA